MGNVCGRLESSTPEKYKPTGLGDKDSGYQAEYKDKVSTLQTRTGAEDIKAEYFPRDGGQSGAERDTGAAQGGTSAGLPLQHSPGLEPLTSPVNWTRGELIGQGAFGRVYLGLNNDTGQLMAVKQVAVCTDESVAGMVAEHVKGLEEEVDVLKVLDHPNIVRYLGTDRTREYLNIFLEFVPGGSIASLLAKFGSFKEAVIKVYTRQILQGLEYLHQHQIMHRDIKGANILVDNTGLVKLADFGASKRIVDLATVDSGAKSIKGTPYWMAPEVIKQTGHGRQADIWSVGCTVIEMATGKPPWSQFQSQMSAMFAIVSSKGPPPMPEELSAAARDFCLLCFNRVPKDRPNASRLLRHPFLADAVPRGHAAPLTNISTLPEAPLPRVLRQTAATGPSPIREEPAEAPFQPQRPNPLPPTAFGNPVKPQQQPLSRAQPHPAGSGTSRSRPHGSADNVTDLLGGFHLSPSTPGRQTPSRQALNPATDPVSASPPVASPALRASGHGSSGTAPTGVQANPGGPVRGVAGLLSINDGSPLRASAGSSTGAAPSSPAYPSLSMPLYATLLSPEVGDALPTIQSVGSHQSDSWNPIDEPSWIYNDSPLVFNPAIATAPATTYGSGSQAPASTASGTGYPSPSDLSAPLRAAEPPLARAHGNGLMTHQGAVAHHAGMTQPAGEDLLFQPLRASASSGSMPQGPDEDDILKFVRDKARNDTLRLSQPFRDSQAFPEASLRIIISPTPSAPSPSPGRQPTSATSRSGSDASAASGPPKDGAVRVSKQALWRMELERELEQQRSEQRQRRPSANPSSPIS